MYANLHLACDFDLELYNDDHYEGEDAHEL